MTDHSYDMEELGNLSFDELMAQSSVADNTDSTLKDVCTDEEANAFTAQDRRRQADSDAVLQAAQEVILQAAQDVILRTTDRHQAKQLVSAGAAGSTVEQTFACARYAIDAVEYTRPPVVTPTTHRENDVAPTDAAATATRLKCAAFNRTVRKATAGDQDAVNTLFDQIRPAIVRYCRARIGRSASAYSAADDVAQEVCVAVLVALGTYTDKPRTFLPFMYGIAAQKVANYYRRESSDRPRPPVDAQDSADTNACSEQIMAADLKIRLGVLLETIPLRQREILVLRLIVGLSAQETASAMGLTPTAVRVSQHRALAKLRNALSSTE